MPGHGLQRMSILAKPPLLRMESPEDFDSLQKALEREIKPHGIVEEMYVADIACLTWEILRLRRCKAAIINFAIPEALKSVVEKLSESSVGFQLRYKNKDEVYAEMSDERLTELYYRTLASSAFRWFIDDEVKRDVSRLLSEFQLDESVIEAQAMRNVSSDLERLDKMMMALEVRRDRALRHIAGYRESLGSQLRESADRLDSECDDVPRPRIPFGVAHP